MLDQLTMPSKVFVLAALASSLILGLGALLMIYSYREHELREFDIVLRQDMVVETQRIIEARNGSQVIVETTQQSFYDHATNEWIWQLQRTDGDHRIVVAQSPTLGPVGPETQPISFPGPDLANFEWIGGRQMRGFSSALIFPDEPAPLSFGIAATMEHVDEEVNEAAAFIGTTFFGLAGLISLIVFFVTRTGLGSITRLSREIKQFQSGGGPIRQADWPPDLLPLVNELNTLEERNTSLVDRHRRQAGDLAHSLKTPIAVLTRIAQDLSPTTRERLTEQTDRMAATLRRNLNRLRTGAITSRATPVHEAVEDIIFAMDVLFHERDLDVRNEVAYDLIFRGHPADLKEIIGNLLENACKWATAKIVIAAHLDEDILTLMVSDDGPGFDASAMDNASRANPEEDGAEIVSGLGLLIVKDIVQLYEGSFKTGACENGGARVTVRLPGGRSRTDILTPRG